MTTTRKHLDELIEKQRAVSIHIDRNCLKGFDLINARRLYHKLDRQISDLCRKSGERRVP